MSVKIVKGDMVKHMLSDNHLTAYAHQANCFCRMGCGIAPLLAKANPEVKYVDNMTEEGDRSKLGTFSRTSYSTYKPIVYNIYGQYHWSKYKVTPNRNTDYDALKQGLIAVKENLLHHCYQVAEDIGEIKEPTLGLPLIGCGLAGGNWEDVVYPMILDIFEDSPVDVTIFEL